MTARVNEIKTKELFEAFKEKYPNNSIKHSSQFGHILKSYADIIGEGLAQGLDYKIGQGAGILGLRNVTRKFSKRPAVNHKASIEYKRKLFGCKECESFIDEGKKKYGRCKVEDKSICFVKKCHKQPDLLMSKENPNGKEWIIFYTDNSFLDYMWLMLFVKIKNRSAYKFFINERQKKKRPKTELEILNITKIN